MIEWEPNKNDANLNIPVDGQVLLYAGMNRQNCSP